MQQGPKGPPFTSNLADSSFSRLLPWNWFSIDGTGWCFDSAWDELRPCGELETPVDWNGVGISSFDEVDAGLPASQLAAIACIGVALAARSAYQAWARQEARRRADEEEGTEADRPADDASATVDVTISLGAWLQSGQAHRPWLWDPAALLTLLSACLGLLVASLLPLPGRVDADLMAEDGDSVDDVDDSWPLWE